MGKSIVKKAVLGVLAVVAVFAAYFLYQAYQFRAKTDAVASYDLVDTTADAGLANTSDGTSARLLSAFHGLDALPRLANAICRGGQGLGGMPVILSTEIDLETMQAGDFEVTTQSGQTGKLHCVSLLPAVDPGELRTVLLIGDLGPSDTDPPVSVEIVGHLYSIDGRLDFKGEAVSVIPLPDGPSLTLAELVDDWTLSGDLGPERVRGTKCPADGTVQALRVTWEGGVTLQGGGELTQDHRNLYTISVVAADGSTRDVTPIEIADLNDGDNNHMLCVDTTDRPLAVSFPAGIVVDPNGDLNPATTIEVTSPN